MMMTTFFGVILALFLTGCETKNEEKKQNLPELDNQEDAKDIRYYADKTLTSLVIPPDLTQPDSQHAFKLSKYATDIKEDVISFSKKDGTFGQTAAVAPVPSNIVVKKSGNRHWLVVDKSAESVWRTAQTFLKDQGFIIKKANKKTGVMETEFLEKQVEIPDQSLGMVRSMFKSALSSSYTLPIIDKYRIRIEPLEGDKKAEIHLSMSSMAEVIATGQHGEQTTIWQVQDTDLELEIEMLYRLMNALGGQVATVEAVVSSAKPLIKPEVKIAEGVGGYAKLTFMLDQQQTWENVSWALDKLDVDIEDKDVKEGSFYVHLVKPEDEGFFSNLFGDDAIKQSFQILVKQTGSNTTEVNFNDLSEKDEPATIDFSYTFLQNILEQF